MCVCVCETQEEREEGGRKRCPHCPKIYKKIWTGASGSVRMFAGRGGVLKDRTFPQKVMHGFIVGI